MIEPVKIKPRDGWDKEFKLMHERCDDSPLINDIVDIEMDEWEWMTIPRGSSRLFVKKVKAVISRDAG